jgi:hypothetical protein
MGEHFDRLERGDDGQRIVVTKGGRRYQYELRRMKSA